MVLYTLDTCLLYQTFYLLIDPIRILNQLELKCNFSLYATLNYSFCKRLHHTQDMLANLLQNIFSSLHTLYNRLKDMLLITDL